MRNKIRGSRAVMTYRIEVFLFLFIVLIRRYIYSLSVLFCGWYRKTVLSESLVHPVSSQPSDHA